MADACEDDNTKIAKTAETLQLTVRQRLHEVVQRAERMCRGYHNITYEVLEVLIETMRGDDDDKEQKFDKPLVKFFKRELCSFADPRSNFLFDDYDNKCYWPALDKRTPADDNERIKALVDDCIINLNSMINLYERCPGLLSC